MGSLFKKSQPPAPPPMPPTYLRDEVNNVEQVPVTNPDGSITYVTRKIPLTGEEKKRADDLNRIMQESLEEIERLSQVNYTPDAQAQKSLNAWENIRQKNLDDTYEERTQEEEKRLARRGLGDSSAGESIRRRRRLDRQEAGTQLQNEKELLVDDVRNKKIGLQQNLYTIASSQTDASLARQYQASTKGQSLLVRQNALRQASLMDYYRAQIKASQRASPFNIFANAAAKTLGGSLGSIF